MKIPQTSYIATVNSRSSPQCWETFPSRWFHSIKHQSTIVNNAVEFFTSHFAVPHQTFPETAESERNKNIWQLTECQRAVLAGDAEIQERNECLSGTFGDGL